MKKLVYSVNYFPTTTIQFTQLYAGLIPFEKLKTDFSCSNDECCFIWRLSLIKNLTGV